jgi:hypothetical protein
MISLLIAWCLIAVVSAACGQVILKWLGADLVFEDPGDRLVIEIWLGMGAAACLFLLTGHFAPITPLPASLLLAATYRVWKVKLTKRPKRGHLEVACYALVVVTLAFHASITRVDAYDTALYHQQAVAWLSRFGIVRGLAWFDCRLGFSSSWYALAAGLNHGVFAGRVSAVLGGFATTFSVLHWLSKIERLAVGCMRPPDWYLLFVYPVMLCAAWSWHYEISLGADLATWIITTLVVWVAYLLVVGKAGQRALCLPLLLAALGSSFKFSVLPLLPLMLMFAVVAGRGGPRRPLAIYVICCIPVLLIISANVATSGCPLYPSALGRIPAEWSVPKQFAQHSTSMVTDFARWGRMPESEKAAHPWIISWATQTEKLGLLILAVLGAIFSAIRWKATRAWFIGWALCVGIGGLALLFWVAPNPRFGLGFFLIFPGIAILSTPRIPQIGSARLAKAGLLSVCLIVSASVLTVDTTIRHLNLLSTSSKDLFLPSAMPCNTGDEVHVFNRALDYWTKLETKQSVLGDFQFATPVSSDQCWNLGLPCSTCILDPAFRLKDPRKGLGAGFVHSE